MNLFENEISFDTIMRLSELVFFLPACAFRNFFVTTSKGRTGRTRLNGRKQAPDAVNERDGARKEKFCHLESIICSFSPQNL